MRVSAPPRTSVLERITEGGDLRQAGALIGLHDAQSRPSDLLPLLRWIGAGRRIVAPRSARWSAYGRGGLYSWYSSISSPLVEPIGFGDSLIQLEALILEEAAQELTAANILIGIGQGGTMALILAALWPEFCRAVIAVDAIWPIVPGWQPPELVMSATHVLLADARDDVREQLAVRGAPVTEMKGMQAEHGLASLCRQWLSAL